jgi:hypothetical protein
VGSLALRPGDSLTIPRMALSVGFIRFVSSPDATPATGLLTLALVGLTPAEHASLRWTHYGPKTRLKNCYLGRKRWASLARRSGLRVLPVAVVCRTLRHPLPSSNQAQLGLHPEEQPEADESLGGALSGCLTIVVVQHSA